LQSSPFMRNEAVLRALRGAVLACLALPAIPACGASTSSNGNGSCSVLSTTPTGGVNGGCAQTFAFDGSPAQCGADDAGTISQSHCAQLCPPNPNNPSQPPLSCYIEEGTNGTSLGCTYSICGTGRRPDGLAPAQVERTRDVPRFLAEMAYLEAASVDAFRALAEELEAHGAPASLRDALLEAAFDEIRHARDVGSLAERAGARIPDVRIHAEPGRTLEAIATHNAVEGCVRETFGAAVAGVQAARAKDAAFRRVMKDIAADEARHAELSWELARWLEGKLDPASRARVARARRLAIADLTRECALDPSAALGRELGLPSAREVRAILGELGASLWS
jgi:hypothetical protein